MAIACIAWWVPLDGKEWKCLRFFGYHTVTVVYFTDQNRISMLKHCIVSGLWLSVKLVFQTETQNSHFCVCPWSLLAYSTFPNGDRQTQRYFNVSSPSSRRDKNFLLTISKQLYFEVKQHLEGLITNNWITSYTFYASPMVKARKETVPWGYALTIEN